MATERDLESILRRIVRNETIWLRHYVGKVLNNDCSTAPGLQMSGMIQVAIYDLGLDTADIGIWCFPRDKNSLITPAIGDWVEVYFINGDRNRPVYMGTAHEISGQIPENYDGQATTQVIFESNGNSAHITMDELANILEIGSDTAGAFAFAARQNDATLSNSSTDSAFWTWVTGLMTALSTFAATASGGPIAFVAGGAALAAALAALTPPTSQTGKINAGSTQVKIGS